MKIIEREDVCKCKVVGCEILLVEKNGVKVVEKEERK